MSQQSPHRPTTDATATDGSPSLDLDPSFTELSTTDRDQLLERYNTDRLKDQFERLFSIVNLVPWALGGWLGSMLIAVAVWGLLFYPQASFAVSMVALAYLLIQGLALGLLAAALLVTARLLQQLTAVIDITIQTLRQAFTDLGRPGDTESRTQLIEVLVHGAILPTLKRIVTVKMGLLRAPIGWVINGLLGRSLTKLSNTLQRKWRSSEKELTPQQEEQLLASADPEAQSKNFEGFLDPAAQTHLERMEKRVERIARRTRIATLIPGTLLFFALAAITSVPWILLLLILII